MMHRRPIVVMMYVAWRVSPHGVVVVHVRPGIVVVQHYGVIQIAVIEQRQGGTEAPVAGIQPEPQTAVAGMVDGVSRIVVVVVPVLGGSRWACAQQGEQDDE
ncbi:MAG: hypothetical protein ACREVM_01035 [Burkholderiales bacterium]